MPFSIIQNSTDHKSPDGDIIPEGSINADTVELLFEKLIPFLLLLFKSINGLTGLNVLDFMEKVLCSQKGHLKLK